MINQCKICKIFKKYDDLIIIGDYDQYGHLQSSETYFLCKECNKIIKEK